MSNDHTGNRAGTVSSRGRKPPANPLQPLIDAGTAVSKPWWAESFSVAVFCFKALYLPIRLIGDIANTLVALAFVMVFGVVGLFVAGYIPDAVVVKYLGLLGDRILSIVQSSGLLQ
jgi:hypothetical protein